MTALACLALAQPRNTDLHGTWRTLLELPCMIPCKNKSLKQQSSLGSQVNGSGKAQEGALKVWAEDRASV